MAKTTPIVDEVPDLPGTLIIPYWPPVNSPSLLSPQVAERAISHPPPRVLLAVEEEEDGVNLDTVQGQSNIQETVVGSAVVAEPSAVDDQKLKQPMYAESSGFRDFERTEEFIEVPDDSEGEKSFPLRKKSCHWSVRIEGPASRVRSTKEQPAGSSFVLDTTRFQTRKAQARYEFFKSQTFQAEQVVNFKEYSIEVKRLVEEAGFLDTVTKVKPFNADVVKEFWSHLPATKVEGTSVMFWVRGQCAV
ncbi:hypothetical protein AALP_AA1G341800 [Arabis alpina]|uniref:Uncharacterized protein n=1 Tax=Arabis alpina TaxID=50452 RepID=A0A087HSI3_ARAAL|nr:hypothetical protein AALP_AA1G341800 [Arabis alpina]